jgi:hypothetical protein
MWHFSDQKEEVMKKMFLLFILYLLFSCSDSTSNENTKGVFSIYLLQDSTLTAANAYEIDLEDLILSETVFITANDLESYNWTSHSFVLNESKQVEFDHFILYSGSTSGIPFVVSVGEEKIYFGTFWWGYSSSMPPPCAVIYLTGPLPHRISLPDGAVDKRNDSRIYNSLKKAGVLIE